jgi:hypothetical protein
MIYNADDKVGTIDHVTIFDLNTTNSEATAAFGIPSQDEAKSMASAAGFNTSLALNNITLFISPVSNTTTIAVYSEKTMHFGHSGWDNDTIGLYFDTYQTYISLKCINEVWSYNSGKVVDYLISNTQEFCTSSTNVAAMRTKYTALMMQANYNLKDYWAHDDPYYNGGGTEYFFNSTLIDGGVWKWHNNLGGLTYVHPTTDGNLHVPATDTTNNGKFLKAGSTAGSIAWSVLTIADVTDLTNQLAAKAAKTDFDTHNGDSIRHITADERSAWNGITTAVQSATIGGVAVTKSGTQLQLPAYPEAPSIPDVSIYPELKTGLFADRPLAPSGKMIYLASDKAPGDIDLYTIYDTSPVNTIYEAANVPDLATARQMANADAGLTFTYLFISLRSGVLRPTLFIISLAALRRTLLSESSRSFTIVLAAR